MTKLEKLLSLGCESVGPDLMFKQMVVGTMANGFFLITPEGEAMCDVDDAPFREVKKPAKAKKDEAPVLDEQLTLDLE